ncbi:regulator [Vibrio cincinnatiensis]|nr:FlhC family transcriptional regulator [Vibrio cincinnatiensis]MCG3760916.1 regulator [Vibrio cincinnatiensis]MCG3764227.1 regulator [Vibrio cincinnatiensis]
MSCNSNLSRWGIARNMALIGYISQIIMIETGLTYMQIRRLYKELKDEGLTIRRKSHKVRGGATIIHSHTSKIEASLLMQLYFNITGKSALRSININTLHSAYELYSSVRSETLGMHGARWQMLDITDAWCLAQELRSGEAMIETCPSCKCNYFTSVNQRTSVNCPFCLSSPQASSTKKEATITTV